MTEKSLKTQAEEIMDAVDRDLQQVSQAKTPAMLEEVDSKANAIAQRIYNAISDVDIAEAAAKVEKLKEKYPQASPQELSQKLIREKCERTGVVGAVTSGAGLIPGIGTAAAITLGAAADIGEGNHGCPLFFMAVLSPVFGGRFLRCAALASTCIRTRKKTR